MYGTDVQIIVINRIGYVVGKACVKVWATKIHTQLQNYLFDTKQVIKESGAKKEQETKSE